MTTLTDILETLVSLTCQFKKKKFTEMYTHHLDVYFKYDKESILMNSFWEVLKVSVNKYSSKL